MAEPILRQIFLFRGAEDALEGLALPAAVTYEKGAIIYGGAEQPRALGVLLSGKAEAVAQQRWSLNRFEAGSVFGAATLFGGGEAYVSTVRAVSRCTVQFIPEDTLRELFGRYPRTAANYIEFLSTRVRFLNDKIAVFTAEGAENKVYHYLTTHADENGVCAAIPMTRLADALGIGRTSLYRAMDVLEEKGLLRRAGSRITLLS